MGLIKGALLDLGGVVYIAGKTLPGAIDAIARLRDAGIGVRCLTNSTRSSHRQILDKLRKLGLTVEEEELFTPSLAARQLLKNHQLSPHLLIHPDLEEDFTGLPAGGNDAVVVGDAGEHFTYATLNAAFRALGHNTKFLALANNRSFRDADGGLSMDAGPFVAALAFASEKEPMILGKPSPAFFRAALASLRCTPQDAVMVGDDVENDVAGAMAVGLSGILVRTGKYEPGDESQIEPPPSAVADSLSEAVEWILASG